MFVIEIICLCCFRQESFQLIKYAIMVPLLIVHFSVALLNEQQICFYSLMLSS